MLVPGMFEAVQVHLSPVHAHTKTDHVRCSTILILKGYILHSLKPLLLVFKLHLYVFHASCKHYKSIKMN